MATIFAVCLSKKESSSGWVFFFIVPCYEYIQKGEVEMKKMYAFLWHVNVGAMNVSEGAGGSSCESASCEKKTKKEAGALLKTWLKQRKSACGNLECEHTPIVTNELSPKMIMSGMTAGMIRLQ